MPHQFTAALSGPLSGSQDDQDIIPASVPVILQGIILSPSLPSLSWNEVQVAGGGHCDPPPHT